MNVKNVDIARKLLKISKKKFKRTKNKAKIKFVKDRPGHDLRYALNSKKINKKLGWKSEISLEKGLLQTFDWYLSNKTFFKSISKKLYVNRIGTKV